MAYQTWTSLLPPGQPAWSGAGALMNTATTATISPMPISPTPNAVDYNVPVPGGTFYTGMLIRVKARLFITTVAASGTLTFFLASNIGNTGTTYVTLATTAALTTGTTVITGLQCDLAAMIRCTAVAAAGTLATQGELRVATNVTAPTLITPPVNEIKLPMPSASGETSATVNTLATQGIALRCTQVTSTCSVQLTQWDIEAAN
jgi:hypothetical protein